MTDEIQVEPDAPDDEYRLTGAGEARAEAEAPSAKVIIVTTAPGRETRYAAPDFGMLGDGTLLIGTRDADGNVDKITVAAAYAPGHWATVCKDGATVPDATARALGIARRALTDIRDQHAPGAHAHDTARAALDEIWNEVEG